MDFCICQVSKIFIANATTFFLKYESKKLMSLPFFKLLSNISAKYYAQEKTVQFKFFLNLHS